LKGILESHGANSTYGLEIRRKLAKSLLIPKQQYQAAILECLKPLERVEVRMRMTRAPKERGLRRLEWNWARCFLSLWKTTTDSFSRSRSRGRSFRHPKQPRNFDAEEKTTEQIIKIWGGSSPLYRARDFIKKTNLQAELMKLNPKPVLGVGWAEDLRKLFFEFMA